MTCAIPGVVTNSMSKPFVLEETFVAGDQHGQVVDRVHDRDLSFFRSPDPSRRILPVRRGSPAMIVPRRLACQRRRFSSIRSRKLDRPISAFFIQRGGRSSSTTSATGLNSLK